MRCGERRCEGAERDCKSRNAGSIPAPASSPLPFAIAPALRLKGMFTKFWHWQTGFAITRRHLVAAMAEAVCEILGIDFETLFPGSSVGRAGGC